VAQLGPLRFSGLVAWLLWCVVHIFFLIGFRNRVRVMLEWMWYYITFKPGARVIYQLPQQFRESQGTVSSHSAGRDSKI
jgi:NADH dehydrogenase